MRLREAKQSRFVFAVSSGLAGLAVLLQAAICRAETKELMLFVDGNALVAEGVSSGGKVLILGAVRDFGDLVSVRRSYLESVGDEDGDGVIKFEPGSKTIPTRSVWVIVDLATSRTAWAAPPEFVVAEKAPFTKKGATEYEATDVFPVQGTRAEVLVVRPNHATWYSSVVDGSEKDLDRSANGEILFETATAEVKDQTGTAPVDGPLKLETGDLLIAIDPVTLEVVAAVADFSKEGL